MHSDTPKSVPGTNHPGTIRDPKPRPNHDVYMDVLRKMTPDQRLAKAFELSAMSRALFRHGLKRRFPDATREELMEIELERIYGWRSPNS